MPQVSKTILFTRWFLDTDCSNTELPTSPATPRQHPRSKYSQLFLDFCIEGIEMDSLLNIADSEKEQSMKSNSINPLNLFMQPIVTAHRTALAGKGRDKT